MKSWSVLRWLEPSVTKDTELYLPNGMRRGTYDRERQVPSSATTG
jgi:hypothetical protein